MAGKQNKKKANTGGNEKVSGLQTFYLNCKRSDKEDRAIELIKKYMTARQANTAPLVMCEFIEEFLPEATKNWKKNRRLRAS